MTHPVLSSMRRERQKAEIVESKRRLQEIIGSRILSFAYPYGGPEDYSVDTMELVRQAGFGYACGNSPSCIGVGWGGSRYAIPRFTVRDWDGDAFARRLQHWLKTGEE
jgi:peptidoglycan/xylan/chitin deacetylase (PgdA/CDA1 family)